MTTPEQARIMASLREGKSPLTEDEAAKLNECSALLEASFDRLAERVLRAGVAAMEGHADENAGAAAAEAAVAHKVHEYTRLADCKCEEANKVLWH